MASVRSLSPVVSRDDKGTEHVLVPNILIFPSLGLLTRVTSRKLHLAMLVNEVAGCEGLYPIVSYSII